VKTFRMLGVLCLVGASCAESNPEPLNLESCASIAATCRAAGRACVPASGDESALCVQCPEGKHPAGPWAQCAPIQGNKLSHDFGDVTLKAGQELDGVCQSWVVGNTETLYVNAVEMVSDGGYHHSNWFFVPAEVAEERGYKSGAWKNCYKKGFHEIDAATAGGVIFAQSTQVKREVQKFQDGAVVRVPPNVWIMGSTHLLNVYPEARDIHLSLHLYTVPADEVSVELTPFRLSYLDLEIPAQSTVEFSTTCDMEKVFDGQFNHPFDVKMHYMLPHYHSLGAGFQVRVVGGEKDGLLIQDFDGFGSDPFGRVFDPPVAFPGATGLSYTCAFQNPGDKTIGWGIGDQEMCVLLGFMESPVAFDATVIDGDVLGWEDETIKHEGECFVYGFEYEPGGTPALGASPSADSPDPSDDSKK